jgi:hypothetical protein
MSTIRKGDFVVFVNGFILIYVSLVVGWGRLLAADYRDNYVIEPQQVNQLARGDSVGQSSPFPPPGKLWGAPQVPVKTIVLQTYSHLNEVAKTEKEKFKNVMCYPQSAVENYVICAVLRRLVLDRNMIMLGGVVVRHPDGKRVIQSLCEPRIKHRSFTVDVLELGPVECELSACLVDEKIERQFKNDKDLGHARIKIIIKITSKVVNKTLEVESNDRFVVCFSDFFEESNIYFFRRNAVRTEVILD